MKHLLSIADLDRESLLRLLDAAEGHLALQDERVKKRDHLRGRTVINLFFEDSTRTRISFEAAAKRLSADVINFSAKGSSVSKGESLKDTALTLQAMGADAVVVGAADAVRVVVGVVHADLQGERHHEGQQRRAEVEGAELRGGGRTDDHGGDRHGQRA